MDAVGNEGGIHYPRPKEQDMNILEDMETEQIKQAAVDSLRAVSDVDGVGSLFGHVA
jgi:hypothetical protein